MNEREKMALLASLAVIGLVGLYLYAVEPLMQSRDALASQRASLEREVESGRKLISQSKRAAPEWSQYRANGLTGDASASGNQLLNAMQAWSQSSSLPLSSARPDRAAAVQGMQEVSFQATADGSMRSLASFLYYAETARIPARIRELQIASRVEGNDDLSMQVRISTLWEEPRSKKEKAAPAAGGTP